MGSNIYPLTFPCPWLDLSNLCMLELLFGGSNVPPHGSQQMHQEKDKFYKFLNKIKIYGH